MYTGFMQGEQVMQDGHEICIQGSCRMGLGHVYRGQAGWAWDMYTGVMQGGPGMMCIQGSCRMGLGYVYRGHAGWAWDMYKAVMQDEPGICIQGSCRMGLGYV